jgi:hypothetical protein
MQQGLDVVGNDTAPECNDKVLAVGAAGKCRDFVVGDFDGVALL